MDEPRLWQLNGNTRVQVACMRCGRERSERVQLLCGEGRMRDLTPGQLAHALRCADSRCGGEVRVALDTHQAAVA